ncbi:MAG: Gfo/Idh/MocA family oxidoreductase [Phycisphaerae bacterium]|nr:Gfo/Idh/MocA family oxidoreductase [Phycisphaerae bacterium]
MSETKEKLKAVVAGYKWGSIHMRGFAESDVADLAAIWSRTDNPGARALAESYNVPLYTDFQGMLDEIRPAMASIAVPESAHEALTVAALDAGCHVYCEKVLASSRDAARRMVDAAEKNGRILNVGYNYRYSPSCIYLAEAVGGGRIGKPLFAHLRAFGCCIHHMTDYVNHLFGKPVRAVSIIDAEPLEGRPHPFGPELVFPTFIYAALTMKAYMVEYESGAVLMAGATDYSQPVESGATLLVEGTDGRLELDDLSGNVRIWSGSRDGTIFSPSQIADKIGLAENGVAALKDFALAVRDGRDAPIPGAAGVRMIALEEAIFRSAETRRWEDVD